MQNQDVPSLENIQSQTSSLGPENDHQQTRRHYELVEDTPTTKTNCSTEHSQRSSSPELSVIDKIGEAEATILKDLKTRRFADLQSAHGSRLSFHPNLRVNTAFVLYENEQHIGSLVSRDDQQEPGKINLDNFEFGGMTYFMRWRSDEAKADRPGP